MTENKKGESKEKIKEINVRFPETHLGGTYSNTMFVTHTKDEFILDYYLIVGPNGIVNSRVITSPGHMKRIINALNENIAKYEKKFGKIKETEDPGENIN